MYIQTEVLQVQFCCNEYTPKSEEISMKSTKKRMKKKTGEFSASNSKWKIQCFGEF